MATPNVIEHANFGNYPAHPTNNYQPITNNYLSVREDEGEYGKPPKTLRAALQSLLNEPLWPQFPDGAYLNPLQAVRLYRHAQSIQGLTHILNRSAHRHDLTKDYNDEPNRSLSALHESQLWVALIEISGDLFGIVDELHNRATEDLS